MAIPVFEDKNTVYRVVVTTSSGYSHSPEYFSEGDLEVVYTDGGTLNGYTVSFWGDEVIVDEYRSVPVSSVESIVEGYDDTDFDWDDLEDEDEIDEEADFIEEGCHGKKKKKKVLTQRKKSCGEECKGAECDNEGCHGKKKRAKR